MILQDLYRYLICVASISDEIPLIRKCFIIKKMHCNLLPRNEKFDGQNQKGNTNNNHAFRYAANDSIDVDDMWATTGPRTKL